MIKIHSYNTEDRYMCLTSELVDGKPPVSGVDAGSTCLVFDSDTSGLTQTYIYDGTTWFKL